MPTRRLEDRIQQLCAQVVQTEDEREVERLCTELKAAISEHVSRLRDRLQAYPMDPPTNAKRPRDKSRDKK